jgi:CubicO group peptidase (beta-lactamase class C family)
VAEGDLEVNVRTAISLSVATLLLLVSAGTRPEAAASPLDGFDAYVAKAVADWKVPGFAIAVVKDGTVVLSKGYGVREAGKPAAVDEHTLFAIGSTTKAMTAALVGMLVDERKLAWDDPVIKHLPWFQLKDPAVTREVTVRDLLTHRAGLGNADFLWYGRDNTTRQILDRVRLLEPAYSLRSGFVYQNVMYAAAGQVIEAASGRTWADMARTRIFEPLGMRETVATLALVPRGANVASPHYLLRDAVVVVENMPVDAVAAAGSVWSSVHDMAKWMQFLLDDGVAGGPGGKRLLSEGTVAELFKPQTIAPFSQYPTTALVKPRWMTYGLGWFQQDYQGSAIDFHTGSIDGMVAIAGLIRADRLGVFALGNLDHAELRHALMYTVFDRYAGRQARDWNADLKKLYGDSAQRTKDAQKRSESQRVAGTSPSLPLDQYAATYSDPLRGDVEVTVDAGALRIRYGPGLAGPLEHWHYNTFRARWKAEWRGAPAVNFIIGPSGRVEALEMSGARFARRRPQA